jgi:hypothetical protein
LLAFGKFPLVSVTSLCLLLVGVDRSLFSQNTVNIMSKSKSKTVKSVAPTVVAFKYKPRTQALVDFLDEITSRPIPSDGHVLTDDEVSLARGGWSMCHESTNVDGSYKRDTNNPQTWSKMYDDVLCHGFKFFDKSRGGMKYTCTIKKLDTEVRAYVTRSTPSPF